MRDTRALIVGGGPAGAAAAIMLARAGTTPLILERTRETGDALCGGFLSWRTLDAIRALGVDPEALNPEVVTRIRVLAGERRAEARLPQPARAVSRRRLDTLLIDRALAAGAAIERGVTVRAIEDGSLRLDDGATITAPATFLASGKHDVRGVARPTPRADEDPAIGLRIRLAAHPALDRLVGDAIELHLFDGGYAGVVRQEDGSVNLCLAARRSRLREAGDADRLLAILGRESPALGDRLAHHGGAIDAVANVPYGWRATTTAPGLYRIGDQAAVIPSLAGEGMGIALASGVAAAQACRAGLSSERWQPQFARVARRPLAVAGAVWHLAERPAAAALLLPLLARAPAMMQIIARLTRIGHQPA